MSIRKLLLLLLHLDRLHNVQSWQTNLRIPIKSKFFDRSELEQIFARLVASDFTHVDQSALVPQAEIPCLKATISCEPCPADKFDNMPQDMVLIFHCAQESDFGWICRLLYANSDLVEDTLDMQPIRSVVARHLNTMPPDPGHAPPPLKKSHPVMQRVMDLLGQKEALHALQQNGYVVIDEAILDTAAAPRTDTTIPQLQDTRQGQYIRTDQVYFLNRQDALAFGWVNQFDALMACATILNERLQFPPSSYTPLPPAKKERPLTVPDEVQLAEYRAGDFYKAHSDNSLTRRVARDGKLIRSNFRAYTCILYINEVGEGIQQDWNIETDGGALRLYLNSQSLITVDDALRGEFVDIAPQRNRLLVFDSCLVHSVQELTHPTKTRRALTLWIHRPNDSGVKGEVYF